MSRWTADRCKKEELWWMKTIVSRDVATGDESLLSTLQIAMAAVSAIIAQIAYKITKNGIEATPEFLGFILGTINFDLQSLSQDVIAAQAVMDGKDEATFVQEEKRRLKL